MKLREGTKKGIGKLKIGLVTSVIVIMVLAGLNIWFYMNKTSLELQLKERWDSWGSELWWHSYYQNMSNQLSTQKDVLQSAYNDYVATHSHTNVEYDTLLSTYNNYVSAYSHSNTEYNALQSAYNDYMATHSHTNSEYDTLQSIYNNYVATHSHTDTEYDALQSAYDNYVATHTHTNTEYDALESERDSLKAPKLIKVAWNEVDVHSGNWHLHVWGAVVNVGTDTAYNCKMHVVCYQGAVIGLDTYVLLYTIAGETSKLVDENLYYAYGSGLTDWSVTLQWTTTP
jgi:hypothetical protein